MRDEAQAGVWVTANPVGLDHVRAHDVRLRPWKEAAAGKGGVVECESDLATEVMSARPDVDAVVHVHSLYATAFSVKGRRLDALSHEGCHLLGTDVAPWRGVSAEGDVHDVVTSLADRNGVLLAGHGLLTAASTLGEAVALAVYLEKACRLQLLVGHRYDSGSDDEASVKRLGQLARPRISWDYLRRTTHLDESAYG
jgi:L-fuculose-phosphate aldolase